MSSSGAQVLAAVDKVAEQLQASGKAKTAAMQDYAIKCYTEILTPLQARPLQCHAQTQLDYRKCMRQEAHAILTQQSHARLVREACVPARPA